MKSLLNKIKAGLQRILLAGNYRLLKADTVLLLEPLLQRQLRRNPDFFFVQIGANDGMFCDSIYSFATREQVRKLEQEYDAAVSEEQAPLPGGELDSDRLMREVEDFLRKQGEGGAGGTGARALRGALPRADHRRIRRPVDPAVELLHLGGAGGFPWRLQRLHRAGRCESICADGL